MADSPPTLGAVLDAYIASRSDVRYLPSIKGHLQAARRHFGDVPVSEITEERVNDFVRAREEDGRSGATIKKQLVVLKTALTWAQQNKLIEDAPFFRPSKKIASVQTARTYTVDQMLTDYIAERGPEVAHPASLEGHAVTLRKHFGELLAEDLNDDLAKAFIAARTAEGRAQGTVDKNLKILRAALNWAYRTDKISRVPYFQTPGRGAERDRFLSAEEYLRFLDAANDSQTPFHIRLFINLALLTAQKTADILELTWDRVRFDAGRGGEIEFGLDSADDDDDEDDLDSHIVPMHNDLSTLLMEAKKRRESDWVIEWRGERVKVVFQGFHAVTERAGLTDLRQTDIRPSWAVLKLRAGVSVYEVAAVLGDDPSKVWRKYAKHLPDLALNAINAPVAPAKKRV